MENWEVILSSDYVLGTATWSLQGCDPLTSPNRLLILVALW